MKIKGLLLGMLACAAMVACTNDDIVENNVDNPQIGELENVPAYITVSIGTSNGSSRATVDGDNHGSAEDSEHGDAGTAEENDINAIAVIIKTVDENGSNVGNSGVAEIIESDGFTTVTTGTENVLTVRSAFKVLAGTHKVLTIVNPTEQIRTAVTSAKAEGYVAIGDLYDKFAKEGDQLSSYGLGYDALKNCAKAIMFVNRDEVTVEARSTNSETSPAVATIMLERPVAKLAYRGNEIDNTYPIIITVTKQEYNVVEADGVIYALVKDAADRIRAVEATNVKDAAGKVIGLDLVTDAENAYKCYTYDNETKTVGVEMMKPIELTGEIESIPDGQYYLLKDEDGSWIAPECIFTPYTEKLGGENGGWNVKLTEYALINLTNDSYVIRHTANELGTEVNTFGLLTGRNYIADPFFGDKNTAATDYDFANVDKWADGDWTTWNAAAGKWFNNTLKDVADETNGTWTGASFFGSLPTTVVDEGHKPENIGTHLQYCFENGVMSHNQLHGLTTGIVFKGEVVGKNLPTMYQYGTEVYEDLNEIFKAYASGNKDIKAVQDAIIAGTYTAASPEGKKAIKDAGIKIYDNNECYYYTNQIKHFDNGDNNVAGNMEFAIVRNNIYSLAVTDIKGIGDAAIDPNPGTENESSVGYIKVEAKIIPWTVRFNNIEF